MGLTSSTGQPNRKPQSAGRPALPGFRRSGTFGRFTAHGVVARGQSSAMARPLRRQKVGPSHFEDDMQYEIQGTFTLSGIGNIQRRQLASALARPSPREVTVRSISRTLIIDAETADGILSELMSRGYVEARQNRLAGRPYFGLDGQVTGHVSRAAQFVWLTEIGRAALMA